MTEQLIAMWNAGTTSSEIARALGLTRSAVMGKIKRLRDKGVALRAAPPPNRPPPKPPRRKEQRRTPTGWKSVLVPIEPPTLPDVPTSVGLLDLTPGMCRYITGRSPRGVIYCGAAKDYKSYCKTHADLCYVPVKEYKRALQEAQH